MKKQKGELLQGPLELLELRQLHSGRFKCRNIIQRLWLVSGEVWSVTSGLLYPAPHRLEKRRLNSETWGPSDNNRRARFYEVTTAGHKQLESEAPGVGTFPQRDRPDSARCQRRNP